MKKFTSLLSLATLCLLGSSVHALYEKNKGMNEWSISNLGQLQDLKFVEKLVDDVSLMSSSRESEFAYSISTDGVLSLFNLHSQKIEWKRQIT